MARMILLYAVVAVYFWVSSIFHGENNDVLGFINCSVAMILALRLFSIECDK